MLGPQGKTPPKTGPATLTRIIIARMFVPKMVKNGFNSVLQTFAGSRRLVAARNSGTNAKSETVPKS
jgi:hypothetical protein